MTEEEKKDAIAEACGWKRGKWVVHTLCSGESELADGWVNPESEECEPDCSDCLNDLNAMHEAEKALTVDQQVEYAARLYAIKRSLHWQHCVFDTLHTTARQRADAFLKTIGKLPIE